MLIRFPKPISHRQNEEVARNEERMVSIWEAGGFPRGWPMWKKNREGTPATGRRPMNSKKASTQMDGRTGAMARRRKEKGEAGKMDG